MRRRECLRERLTFSIFSSFALLVFFIPNGAIAAESLVKVRISAGQTSVSITALDLRIQGIHDSARLSPAKGAAGSSLQMLTVSAARKAGRTMWTITEKATGHIQQRFVGDDLLVHGDMLRVSLKPVPGSVLLHADHTRSKFRFDVIALLPLEVYLRGVLPREMPADWPIEALKAQAIASRSFALEKIRARDKISAAYHLENSTLDQVFAWDDLDDVPTAAPAVDRALRETVGMVLTDANGSIVPAYFHADCGGQTEDASAVWGAAHHQSAHLSGRGSRRGMTTGTALDRGCPFSPNARWTWTAMKEELFARLRVPLGLPAIGGIVDVRPEEHSVSGRVQRLAIVLEGGQIRRLSGHELRTILGFERVKSANFEVLRSGSSFRFVGRGHGHGVGLCQWGARRLASDGADFRRILRHYYPNARLLRL